MDAIHDELDQRVFNGIDPRPNKIRFIRNHFMEGIKDLVPNPEDYFSLYLTGSLTTYQYSDNSDCDISVFPDYDKLQEVMGLGDPQLVRKALIKVVINKLDGVIVPGTSHPIQHFVVLVGNKPGDLYKPGVRSAWSFQTESWFVPPEKDRVHNVKQELPAIYLRAHAIAEKMRVALDTDPKAAIRLFQRIHIKRTQDQRAGRGDFCFALGTKILTANYEWKNIEDIEVGEVLLGFDKEVPGGKQRGKQRTFQPAVVRSSTTSILPSFKISTNYGDVTASAEHPWLVRNKKRMLEWRKTRDLKIGDQILRFGSVWGESCDPVKAAYLAGIFDGEGHMTAEGRLSFSQKEGLVRQQAQQFLRDLGFDFCTHRRNSDEYDWAWNMQVYGGVRETMRFLSQIPTVRVGRNNPLWWIGRSITPKNRFVNAEESIATIIDLEDVGNQEVIGLGTTTGTLIAEGLFSSNSEGNIVYKYLLHEGLFDRLRQIGIYIAKTAGSPDAGFEDWTCPKCGASGRDNVYEDPEGGFECRHCGRPILSKVAAETDPVQVIYDFNKDRIILGTKAQAAALPSGVIIGTYKDGQVTMYEVAHQWLNTAYFKKLWYHSFPTWPLSGISMHGPNGPQKVARSRPRIFYVRAFIFLDGDKIKGLLSKDNVSEHYQLLEDWIDTNVDYNIGRGMDPQEAEDRTISVLQQTPRTAGHVGQYWISAEEPSQYVAVFYSDFYGGNLTPSLKADAMAALQKSFPNIIEAPKWASQQNWYTA